MCFCMVDTCTLLYKLCKKVNKSFKTFILRWYHTEILTIRTWDVVAFVRVFCSSTGSLKSHCMILLKPAPREIPTRIVSTWSPGRVCSHLSKIQSAIFENHWTLFSKLKEFFVGGSRLNLGKLIVVLWLWLYKAFSILCWLLGSSFLFQWSAALDLVCHHLNLLKSRTSWGWVNIP